MRAIFGSLMLLAVGCATSSPRPTANEALPFIEDNYADALSAAKARRVPLFVDGWAPW